MQWKALKQQKTMIKVGKPNLLRDWQTTAGFIGQCFKKLSLDNKN